MRPGYHHNHDTQEPGTLVQDYVCAGCLCCDKDKADKECPYNTVVNRHAGGLRDPAALALSHAARAGHLASQQVQCRGTTITPIREITEFTRGSRHENERNYKTQCFVSVA